MKCLMRSRLFCFILLSAALTSGAVEVPAGTELQVRLLNKVSTDSSHPKDAVNAVLTAPVLVKGQPAIPAGTKLKGQVSQLKPSQRADERALLQLSFSELTPATGRPVKIQTKLLDVDNARESVDATGKVIGILASETLSSRIDQGIGKLAERNEVLAGILEAAKGAVLKETNAQIAFEPGVEMTLQLTEPVRWEGEADSLKIPPVQDEAGLYRLVNQEPFQTMAENPQRPSDLTNLMFLGTQQQLEEIFKEAGWSTAQSLTKDSALETFRAIVELRSYKEAPVSTLLLQGRPPDLVFQKANNTFAQRHHLRIWRRPENFHGQPVWVCASTHDIGITFSDQNHTFIHQIDPQIDKERAKVVSDLLFTKRVKSLALVARPEVPTHAVNATGDAIETDARMAVVFLN